jgi:hypothetical protein
VTILLRQYFISENIVHETVHANRGVEIHGEEMFILIGSLCYVGFIEAVRVVSSVSRQTLSLSFGPNLVRSTRIPRQNPVSEIPCFK